MVLGQPSRWCRAPRAGATPIARRTALVLATRRLSVGGSSHTAFMAEEQSDEWTVERHLAGQPDFAIDLYRRFISMVEALGPFTYAVSKTTITLKGVRRGFAGARPTPSGLRGYFDIQRAIEGDSRIMRASPYTKRLFVHHFRVTAADQLDDEFAGWLAEAYAVGAGAHLD